MIEPCCAERQLPALIKHEGANGQVAVYTTNGDVTIQHFFRSVAHLAGPRQRMTLVTQRTLGIEVLRKMKYWMQRDWEDGVRVMTADDQTEAVRTETAGFESRVTVVQDAMVKSDLLAFEGNQGTVIIQGDMLSEVDAGLRTYSIVYDKTGKGETVRSLLSPIESRFKLAERKAARKAAKIKTDVEPASEAEVVEPASEAEVKTEETAVVADAPQSPAKSEPTSDSTEGQEIS